MTMAVHLLHSAATAAAATPCGSLAACARNMSVVVDFCGTGSANQSWQLEGVTGPEPALARVRLRSGISNAEGPLCAGAGAPGESPDLPGEAAAVNLVPCSAATVWEHNPTAGTFHAANSSSTCGSLDAGVYHVPPALSAGANVVCYPTATHGSNQVFRPVAGHADMLSTNCNGQRLCLTARLLASDHMPTPPPPPLPPPPPPREKDSLFGPFDADTDGVCLAGMKAATSNPKWTLGCPCWRIPSVVVADKVILVLAEGRWFLGDGCEPIPTPSTTNVGDRRAIFVRRSTDNGASFGPIRHVVGNRSANGTAANPTVVYLPRSKTLLMHYDCGTCASTTGEDHGRSFQLTSTDLGISWSQPASLGRFLGPWDGVAPGPGAGLRLREGGGAHAGRLFMAGHYDPAGKWKTQLDVAWYSDDSGETWKLSAGPPLPPPATGNRNEFVGFDEPQFTELRNGSILLSLRRDGHGSRGQALSSDGGASFRWSADTIPNHAGGVQQPLVTLANGTLLYSAPNHDSRSNMTVFVSTDEATSWTAVVNVYRGPSAYSSLAQRGDGVVVLAYERDVAGCNGNSCAIQWTLL